MMDSNTEPRSRRYAPVGSLNLGTEALKPDPEFPVVGFKASLRYCKYAVYSTVVLVVLRYYIPRMHLS